MVAMAMVMVMVMVMVTVSTRVIGAISRDFERFRLWKLFRPPISLWHVLGCRWDGDFPIFFS